ncbi:hypothetical protein COV19_05665 [Candidatus Woesearchaeota archaeon CG10_big_fil_rev_8_21_14_0_10_44_13]|nr:MAG: hypothetical protein COV19_05665 [Candidatus Woesearchaeota archaeon CG10_big_fil_rev_8_21_14_0_10_44_13]
MVRKLSDKEKELINVRLSYIKENNSFVGKVFFTIVSIVVGGIYLLFQSGINWTEPLTKLIVGTIIFGLILFWLRVIISLSNIRFSYDGLIEKIINSRSLSDYKIKKTSEWVKIFDALPIGYLSAVLIILFSNNLKTSLISGLLIGIVIYLIFRNKYH